MAEVGDGFITLMALGRSLWFHRARGVDRSRESLAPGQPSSFRRLRRWKREVVHFTPRLSFACRLGSLHDHSSDGRRLRHVDKMAPLDFDHVRL